MTCTCKRTNDLCEFCGHVRRDCWESCQRGLHDRCKSVALREAADYVVNHMGAALERLADS